MSKIVVIGSGHMGGGIAAIFLALGHEVVVLGRDPRRVAARFEAIRALADDLVPAGGPAGALNADTIDRWAGLRAALQVLSVAPD